MRKLGLVVVAAATLMASGAYAQVGIGVGPGGVSVGVGQPGYRGYDDGYRYRDRDRDWRRSRAEERVIIRERRDRPRKVVREYVYD